jgi:thiol-disulfide isomerase/thioredoxin
MKKYIFLLALFFMQLYYAQKESVLEIEAPDLQVDSLFITYPAAARNTHLLHKYKLSADGSKAIGEGGDIKFPLQKITAIKTDLPYPQPANFSYYNRAENSGMASKTFFIEKGNLKFLLKDDLLNFEILSPSPANTEYAKLKAILEKHNSNLKPFENNAPELIKLKEAELKKYIAKNPNSFVAMWEIADDFSKYGYHSVYLDNLKLFGPKVKAAYAYKEFIKLLNTESESIFPDIDFDNNNRLSKQDFAPYKLTLIDYWATFCKPCIEDMPKLVALYEQYKSQGVNFISVTDEQSPERIKKAKEILRNNKVSWKDYVDINKEFPKKLNAGGYPLQILVDSEGRIVKRTYGELGAITAFMQDYLK